ncbi:23018_t:CDS:2 [Cetraspora pellucida]|uniref:23018_t:CDS:1 n=1 Tax=Cetraspora pellucida TaxID=1433469 RepID=A0A9N8ZK70_9GLOM|nr:23018_t:CDS:2 [Cetraspora pellucida]
MLSGNTNQRIKLARKDTEGEIQEQEGYFTFTDENTLVITLDKLGRFHFHVSIPLEDCENQTPVNGRVVALDPGVRTFMTCYGPSGRFVEWGSNDFNIVSLRKRTNYKVICISKAGRIQKNKISVAKKEAQDPQTIFIPTFETSNMGSRPRETC